MNRVPFLSSLALAGMLAAQAEPAHVAPPRPVDLAICLDISGSMDGLLNAARQNLWAVVNELAQLQPKPVLRVALLTYGCTAHSADSGWVKLETGFTTDLDLVSQKLFELSTNGGEEYVARVVRGALDQLEWSTDARAMRMLFVAGNEAATQDPKLDVAAQSSDALARGVLVNSIYCGGLGDGEVAGWRRVAAVAGGQFTAIEQDKNVLVATPFDQQLSQLSAELNTTYVPFGSGGSACAANQVLQDANAATMNPTAVALRCQTKAGGLYSNPSWDLVDACKDPKFVLVGIDRQLLPEALRGLSVDDLQAYVATQTKKRAELQQRIESIGRERDAFVQQELRRREASGEKVFEQAVLEIVRAQAAARGFERAAPIAPAAVVALPSGGDC